MVKNSKKFLLISFSILIAGCICMLTLASALLARKSDNAVSEIGEIYMYAMAKQTQQNFDAVVSLQIS